MKKLLLGTILTLGPLINGASGTETAPAPPKAAAVRQAATETRTRNATAKDSGATAYVASKGATPAKNPIRNVAIKSPTSKFFKAIQPYNLWALLDDSDRE